MLMRGDTVWRYNDLQRQPGTVTGILNGLVIVAWRFGNTTTHRAKELRRS